jgi:prophage antirepressor-like protein
MNLTTFKYEDEDDHVLSDMTTVEMNGEIWFVAAEVCALLDIKNPTSAISSLDEDEKLITDVVRSGQSRKVNLINESGLYNLVFRSTKAGAKKFKKWVTKDVIPSIRKTGSYSVTQSAMPNFMTRFHDNSDRTEKGRFSVISELFIRLYGSFERVGYLIPDKAYTGKEIRPDVSVGLGFSKFLQAHHPNVCNNFTSYMHKFPNGLEFSARQYSNDLLPLFIKYVEDHWIPASAAAYFGDRDQKALEYLPKLLAR